MDRFLMTKPTAPATSIIATAIADAIYNMPPPTGGPLDGHIMHAERPTNVLNPEASKTDGHLLGAKIVDRAVQSPTHTNGTQKDKSRLG
ncbi:MAG TPA: hypothetical protein VGK64_05570 [Bryobacteraceae bacterium]